LSDQDDFLIFFSSILFFFFLALLRRIFKQKVKKSGSKERERNYKTRKETNFGTPKFLYPCRSFPWEHCMCKAFRFSES